MPRFTVEFGWSTMADPTRTRMVRNGGPYKSKTGGTRLERGGRCRENKGRLKLASRPPGPPLVAEGRSPCRVRTNGETESMAELKTIRRVTVYAESAMEPMLTRAIMDMGARGYTVTTGQGMGRHETLDDPFSNVNRVRIELMVRPKVAEQILQWIAGPTFSRRSVAACMEAVEVVNDREF